MRMRLPLLPLCLVLGACNMLPPESSALHAIDAVVVVHGENADELGVSTDYGVLFLGRTAQSGRVEFTAYFGDGPSREEGVIESLGGGVYATEAEILLPSAQLCFTPPPPGSEVVVRGRKQGVPYEILARLDADARLTGILLEPNAELDALDDSALGAGIFLVDSIREARLLGLLSGRMELSDGKRYFTALGPEDFWRLVVQRRNSERPRRAVYREDIL